MTLDLVMPFWGLDRSQLDSRWIEQGRGVEAILFSGEELSSLSVFERNIVTSGVEGPITLHFPMDADYVGRAEHREGLYRFIDVASRVGAHGVVLHSNTFVQLGAGPVDYVGLRERHLSFLHELDEHIAAAPLWVGVENMPLVGDDGSDTDGLFVYPEDYAGIDFGRVRAVFDVAHWVGTIQSGTQLRNVDVSTISLPPIRDGRPDSFGEIRDKVAHLHLSAMSGVASPLSGVHVVGGLVPDDAQSGTYAAAIRPFIDLDLTASLEIAERDYTQRSEIWRMVDWLEAQL